MTQKQTESPTLFRDYTEPVIVYHNRGETPFVKIPHLHSQYELCYNIFGAQSFFIAGKFYKCRPHDLFLIPKTQIHKLSAMQNVTYERCILNISPSVVEAINSNPLVTQPLTWLDKAGNGMPHRANLDEGQNIEFLRLCESWAKEKDSLKKTAILLCLLSICHDAFLNVEDTGEDDYIPETLSDKAIALIERDFNNITPEQISKALFVSEDYLCRIFHDETGVGIGKYITLRKLAEAKKLLFLGKSVKEACNLCGFGDYSSFIRTFKRTEGYPPGKLENLSAPLG